MDSVVVMPHYQMVHQPNAILKETLPAVLYVVTVEEQMSFAELQALTTEKVKTKNGIGKKHTFAMLSN